MVIIYNDSSWKWNCAICNMEDASFTFTLEHFVVWSRFNRFFCRFGDSAFESRLLCYLPGLKRCSARSQQSVRCSFNYINNGVFLNGDGNKCRQISCVLSAFEISSPRHKQKSHGGYCLFLVNINHIWFYMVAKHSSVLSHRNHWFRHFIFNHGSDVL